MKRVLTGWIVLCCIVQPALCADPPPIALTQITIASEPTHPNLLDNPGFEDVRADGIPTGWNWDRRNTTATISTDDAIPHGGRRSIKITNDTAEGANVYGMLTQARTIRLTPGQPYTISAFVRSASPGIVWIGGGADWQYRLRVPDNLTADRWRRIQMTFTPEARDAAFVLHVGTDSPTAGVWIDDLKLEAGDSATPDSVNGDGPRIDAAGDGADPVTAGDGPWAVSFDLSAAQSLAGARLEATIQSSQGAPSPAIVQPLAGDSGTVRVTVHGSSDAADAEPDMVLLRAMRADREIASGAVQVRFLSPKRGLKRLAVLRGHMPALTALLASVRAKGQDASYPLVSLTVLENFVGFVEEDLRGTQVARGFDELGELEAMAGRVDTELRAANDGRWLPDVPRWTGTLRPRVAGPSFIGPVAYPAARDAKRGGVGDNNDRGRLGRGTLAAAERPKNRPIFFVGYGHFNQVRKDIEKFPSYGANIVQFEIGPSNIFPKDGVVDDTAVRQTRAILDRAAKAGVAVDLLISPHYMPQWMLDKYPSLRVKREGFLQYSLHVPEAQEFLKRYIATILPPLKDSPALQSICLTNEPVNAEEPDPDGARDWHAWLNVRHGDIATLNSRWGTHFTVFDDAPLPNPLAGPTPDVPRPSPIWLDFIRYNQEFFAGWHKLLADAVHAAAPGLPVTAKPMTWTFLNDQAARLGIDAELFAAMTGPNGINGNDSFEGYTYGHGDFAQDFVTSEEAYDLQRSVRDAPVFNSENHVINDRETRSVPGEHLRALLWQDALHGQSATTIWVWERSNDPKSDIYGNIMHHPAATEATGRVALDLNRLAPEVTALQKAAPQVLLLQSVSASVWDGPSYADCQRKLYTALAFTGLPTGFVTERQLEAGHLPTAPLLLIPNVTHLSDTALSTLQHYTGHIVFVGDGRLTQDEFGHARAATVPASSPPIPYVYGKTTWEDLWAALPSTLAGVRVAPPVQVGGADGKPIWGVEWRCAQTPEGMLVSVCNYRNEPLTIRLWRPGERIHDTWAWKDNIVSAVELISGTSRFAFGAEDNPIEERLQPLEVRLYRVP